MFVSGLQKTWFGLVQSTLKAMPAPNRSFNIIQPDGRGKNWDQLSVLCEKAQVFTTLPTGRKSGATTRICFDADPDQGSGSAVSQWIIWIESYDDLQYSYLKLMHQFVVRFPLQCQGICRLWMNVHDTPPSRSRSGSTQHWAVGNCQGMVRLECFS